jgi:hypothetical protein
MPERSYLPTLVIRLLRIIFMYRYVLRFIPATYRYVLLTKCSLDHPAPRKCTVAYIFHPARRTFEHVFLLLFNFNWSSILTRVTN